ncbi:protein kinase [Streptomyces sp. NPDC006678]|uniref:serine/threonine-protein kinase n=1 Tax=Streptomyces sp. NPDC006678 TaxID=3157185 RepID=UPI0033EA771D
MTEGEGAERLVAGRYRLLRRLGVGGMGRVWLAHDQKLECDVALKELALPIGISEEELSARITRARVEARHAARLRSHPHVATVHDVFEDNDLPWIVMEFVPGARDLAEVVRSHGPLPCAATARIGAAVLDALMAGHRAGILHRDVKPANILLAEEPATEAHYRGELGQVLLADYGISLQPDSGEPRLTATSGIVGTPGFLAPERARGAPPSPASDLFSLGATLYYAVEGNGPFDRPTPYGTLTALLFEEPPPPVRAGDLGPVLAGLLAKDPDQRMGSDEAMRKLAELADMPRAAPRMREPAAETTQLQRHKPSTLRSPPGAPPAEEGQAAADGATPPSYPWRAKLRSARVLGGIAVVLVLVAGGVWAGAVLLNGPNDKTAETGKALPYGNDVELTRELKPGDCVHASWPEGRFKDLPKLKIVDCNSNPDGQVLDTNASTSLGEAKSNGQGICIGLLRDTTRKMVDVQSFALVPSGAGWDSGVRNTACLLFGKTVSLYGPVGDHRKHGEQIFVENSSIGDCYNTRKLEEHNYAHILVDCTTPHELQGVGYVKAPQGMKFGSWDAIYDLCVKRYGSYKNPSRDLYGWVHAEQTWNQDFRFVMCLLAMPKPGQKLPPGSSVPT